MPPIIARCAAALGKPHHHMGYAATDLVIATRAPIDLRRARSRDRHDDVVVSVGAGFHALLQRQRP
ncbi:hypothetical protein A5649_18240 [Mycolicibacter heraklionensis]|uniref:Uncharacterized protein n=1 Tax=Mycolicibacter heraklionensis TaxID=512402 RepID=A0AA91F160_9MYCO|nr:hypothetical protein A5649_18240 [Mycolicibacter heraklionensis]